MYTLRRISSQGVEMNQFLGDSYTLVHKDSSKKEFKRSFESVFNQTYESSTEKVYAFVSNEGGSVLFPLYENQYNYIVSPNGSTLENLSYK